MHHKDYIVVKDRHPRISEVLNDCVNLCVPACKNEPLSSILQKICGKLTEAIADIDALEDEVGGIGGCPTLSTEDGNIIECREDGLYATVSEGGGESLRFGVFGEDATASENRNFDFAGFEFGLTNVVEDNSSNKILALDNNFFIKRIDRATLGVGTTTLIPNTFFSLSGTSGGGSAFYDITGLIANLIEDSNYLIEVFLVINDNSANGPEEYLLEFDNAPISGHIIYELIGREGLTITNGITYGNDPFFTADWTSHYIPGVPASSITSPLGAFSLRITGMITTSATPTVAQMKAGIFAGIGDWAALKGSYIKVTKL